jgi:chorismate mutase
MADKINAGSPMAEIEARASVQPIEELLDERATLIQRVANLRAVYGSFGTWEAQRKMMLARLKGQVRAEALRGTTARKLTNDQIDDEAHDHPEYMDFITMATKERAAWIVLEAKIEAIDFRIQRGQAVVRFASAEARL